MVPLLAVWGANLEIGGASEPKITFHDSTHTEIVSVVGGTGALNSSVPVFAPDFQLADGAGTVRALVQEVVSLRADLTALQAQFAAFTALPPPPPPAGWASSCEQLYQSGDRTSGIKQLTYSGSTQNVYCDQQNFGGGWTLVMKGWGGSMPSTSDWRSTGQYQHQHCRDIAGYVGNDYSSGNSYSSSDVSCHFSKTDMDALRTTTWNGRIRWEARGRIANNPGWPNSNTLDCTSGGRSHHCSYVQFGFLSGACAFDMTQQITVGTDCTRCSLSDYGRGAFDPNSANNDGHGGVYGFYCAPTSSVSGAFLAVGYTPSSNVGNRRWMVDSMHHGDTTGGLIESVHRV